MVVYAVTAYVLFLGVLAYFVGFVEGLVVPRDIDDGPAVATWLAVTVDVGLLGVFAVQHSVMARPGFKRWWTRHVPQPVERTTYVLAATGALALLMWLWRPLPTVLWDVSSQPWRGLLLGAAALGWAMALVSTFLIDHLHLFGLRQVLRHHRDLPPADPDFGTPWLYRYVRHPLMTGFLLAFWATPTMTVGRLLFALGMTTYILAALRLEERDLTAHFGERYRRYRERVPMLLPDPTGRGP